MADNFILFDPKIEGESTDSKHKGEIELLGFSVGGTQSASASTSATGGGGSGKCSMQDFHFSCVDSKASPKLFLAMCTGEHLKSAKVTCRKAGKDQQEFLTIKMTEVVVSGFQTTGSGSNPPLVDQVSLDYGKIEWDYKEQKPDGTLGGSTKAGYDLTQNKSV